MCIHPVSIRVQWPEHHWPAGGRRSCPMDEVAARGIKVRWRRERPTTYTRQNLLATVLQRTMRNKVLRIIIINSLKCVLPKMVSDVVLTDPGIADVTDDSGWNLIWSSCIALCNPPSPNLQLNNQYCNRHLECFQRSHLLQLCLNCHPVSLC